MKRPNRRRGTPGRKKSGRYKANGTRLRDEGTPELNQHRQRLVGPEGNPTMAENPLQMLRTRGLIDERQMIAGLIFSGQQAGIVSRKPFAEIFPWDSVIAQKIDASLIPSEDEKLETPEERRARMRWSYGKANRVLTEITGNAVRSTVNAICVDQMWPNTSLLAPLIAGLTVLVKHYNLPAELPPPNKSQPKVAKRA